MRDDITSIPVSEVFEPCDGCPVCRLRNTLENRVIDYITGPAMMEPDIRQDTNKQGFCYSHYKQMVDNKNRLSVALILESHLAELEKAVFTGPPVIGKSSRRQAGGAEKAAQSCFVCGRIDWAMERMLATVCRLWENERDFRKLFEQQPMLCLPHFSALAKAAEKCMSKKHINDFLGQASQLCRGYLAQLKGDVSHFTTMFDYRNSGENADWGNSKDSIERAVWFLCSRDL